MDVTRRSDYACRILQAAYRNGDAYTSVSEIAQAEGIPYAFARSIQHDLVKSGLIRTVRGARGGLALNCDPKKTTMLDVLEAIQGPVSIAVCSLDPSACERQPSCVYNKMWQGADRILNAYFSSIVLQDLFDKGANHPAIASTFASHAEGSHIPCSCTHSFEGKDTDEDTDEPKSLDTALAPTAGEAK